MFALCSTGVALAVVPIIIPNDKDLISTIRPGYVIVRIIFGVAVIAICSGYIHMHYKSSNVTDGDRSAPSLSSTEPRSLQTKYMLITLFIFGAGTILSCILYIADYWLKNNKLGVIDNIVYIIILTFQLTFFKFYEGEVLQNKGIFHYTIAVLVGAEIWAWVGETLWPFWIMEFSYNQTGSEHNHENTNITGLPPVLEFVKEFLEPFYVEFATIAIGILFHLWYNISKSRDFNHADDETHRIETSSRNQNISYRKLKMIASIGIGLIFSVIFICICVLTGFKQNVFPHYIDIFIYRFNKLVYFASILIISSILLFQLRKEQPTQDPFTSSEYILLLGTCSDSIYYIFRVVASIGYLLETDTISDTRIGWLYLVYCFIALPYVWMQTKLLITIHRKRIPEYVKYFLVFISAVNFCEWFVRAVQLGLSQEGDSETVMTPMMEKFFGESSTRIMRLLLLPVMILFRFHSGLVAVELIHEH